MQEDKRLKGFLVLQSFCPLFLLICIKHFGHVGIVLKFFRSLFNGDLTVIGKAVSNPLFGDVIITTLCVIWFFITVIVAIGFRNFQNTNFVSNGEKITIVSEKKDSGVTFLISFILPLLVDDVSTIRGVIFFTFLLTMVIFFLIRSDLFYQNPVFVVLNYKTFEFKFDQPNIDVSNRKTYIGLSKEQIPTDGAVIKRKYIADDVFLIFCE